MCGSRKGRHKTWDGQWNHGWSCQISCNLYVEDCSSTTHVQLDCVLTKCSKCKAHAHKITSRIAEFYQRFLQKHSSTYFLPSSCCSKMRQDFHNQYLWSDVNSWWIIPSWHKKKTFNKCVDGQALTFSNTGWQGQFIHYSQEYVCRSWWRCCPSLYHHSQNIPKKWRLSRTGG